MFEIKRIAYLVAVSATLALLAGSCSDDDGGGPTGGGNVDNTAPAISSIAATDYRHIEVVFDEPVDKSTAEHSPNYSFVEATLLRSDVADAPESPGDPVEVYSVALGGDDRTVTIVTSPMSNANYNYAVTGVRDLNGNAIKSVIGGTFQGTDAGDNTGPQIVYVSPSPGATGVGLGEPVVIQFDEPLYFSDLVEATSWTYNGGVVLFNMDVDESSNTHTLTPVTPLPSSTMFTVRIDSTVGDIDGNHIEATSWSFTTTGGTDNSPPSLISTTPRDGQTNVAVDVDFRLQFSEPVSMAGDIGIILTPNPGDGVGGMSPDGTTLTFDPDEDLQDDQQYTMVIPKGAVSDLAGNPLDESYTVRFTTGSSFASGSISGTLSGDPASSQASSPDGALVFVTAEPLFGQDDGEPSIAAAVVVGSGGDYLLDNLEDGQYYPTSIMDSNGDGKIDPELGDAIGAWGINLHPDTLDYSQASVTVASSDETGVDFRLWDLSVISGYFQYVGTQYALEYHQHYAYVGVFNTDGFDPDSLSSTPPDYYADSLRTYDQDFYIGDYEEPIADGTYYVGAYLDVNGNGDYDPDVDPGGFYMSGDQLAPVTIAEKGDAFGVTILLEDPVAGAAPGVGGVSWETGHKNSAKTKRLLEKLKKALAQSSSAGQR
ncbi:MAG: Ig-like domain-containing protein [Candidatus Latescibacterota bacterium]|jgi:hypothetical protein